MAEQSTSDLERVIAVLRQAGPKAWSVVSEGAGVPESTIRKIAYRETTNPRYDTVRALFEYLVKA